MKAETSPHVTGETFQECWTYAAGKLSQIKRSRLVERITDPVCHILFLAEVLYLSCGLLYSHVRIAALNSILLKLPYFPILWGSFRRKILSPIAFPDFLPDFAWELIVGLLLAWLIPMLLGLALTGVLRLIYHPRTVPVPDCEGDEEKARQLLGFLRKIQYRHRKLGAHASTLCAAIYLLLAAALFVWLLFTFPEDQKPAIFTFAGPYTSQLLILALPAVYFLYATVNYPLYYLLSVINRCSVPKDFVSETQEFVRSALPGKEADALLYIPIQDYGGFRKLSASLRKRFLSLPPVVAFKARPMGFPCPLAPETFEQAWLWANRKRYWTKKKLAVRKLTSPFLHLYFAAMLFFMVFGDLHDLKSPVVTAFLQDWGTVSEFWGKLRPALYQGLTGPDLTGRRIFLLYLIPIAFILAAALLVLGVYHPRKEKLDRSQSPEKSASQLYSILFQTDTIAKTRVNSMAGFSQIAFFCMGTIVLMIFLVFCYGDPEVSAMMGQTHILRSCILLFVCMVPGYLLIRLPLSVLLWLITFSYVTPRALQETENFIECISNEPKTPAASDDEEETPCQNPTTKS